MYDIIKKEKKIGKSIKNSRSMQKTIKPHIINNRKQSNKTIQCCGFRQIDINKAVGASVEDLAWEQIRPLYPKAARQVHVDTNVAGHTVRIIVDIMVQDNAGNFILYEVKASRSAPLTHNQQLAYPNINQNGATIISRHAIRLFGTNVIPPGVDGYRIEP